MKKIGYIARIKHDLTVILRIRQVIGERETLGERISPTLASSSSALLAMILVTLILSMVGCVGYTPPAIPETGAPTQAATKKVPSPSQTVGATKTLAPTTSPAPTLGLKKDENLRGIEVQFWYVAPQGGEQEITAKVDEFNRTNEWGVRVRATQYQDFNQLQEGIQANLYGDLPGVVSLYPYQLAALSASGSLLLDLESYVSDPNWGLAPEEKGDFNRIFWEQDQQSGARLGIPFYRLAYFLFYNQSWGKELGFSNPPETIQEFKTQVCKAAKEIDTGEDPGGRGRGGWETDSNPAVMASLIFAFGGDPSAAGGKGYAFNTPETRQAFQFLRDLVDNGCARMDDGQTQLADFANRKALVISGSISGLPAQASAANQGLAPGIEDLWTVLPFPSPLGKPVFDTYGPSLGLLRSTPEKQLAGWLFISWLTSTENQAGLVQASGCLPVRSSALSALGKYRHEHPQWDAAVNLLDEAKIEPGLPSWKTVRLALGDAGAQLFSPTFTAGQIPELLDMLDQTAAEIHAQGR